MKRLQSDEENHLVSKQPRLLFVATTVLKPTSKRLRCHQKCPLARTKQEKPASQTNRRHTGEQRKKQNRLGMKWDLMDKTDKNEPASRILLENKSQFLTSNKHGWHSKAFRQIRLLSKWFILTK